MVRSAFVGRINTEQGSEVMTNELGGSLAASRQLKAAISVTVPRLSLVYQRRIMAVSLGCTLSKTGSDREGGCKCHSSGAKPFFSETWSVHLT